MQLKIVSSHHETEAAAIMRTADASAKRRVRAASVPPRSRCNRRSRSNVFVSRSRSVRGRPFHMLHDEDINGRRLRFEFQAELFLKRRE